MLKFKVGDFHHSIKLPRDQIVKFQCGNPEYMAPELLKNEFYQNQVDIWSLGVIVYNLVCATNKEISYPSPFAKGVTGENE